MKTTTVLFVFIACVTGMISCADKTDWNAKYLIEAKKAIATVEEKYEYIKPIYDKELKRTQTEEVCIVRNSVDELSETEAFSIAIAHPEKQKKTEKPDNVMFLHFGPSLQVFGDNDLFSSYYYHKINDDGTEEYYSMREYYLINEDSPYIQYVCESKLSDLNKDFIEPLSKAKYLAVVEDLVLAKPQFGQGGFIGGGVAAMVYMYNLETFEKMDSFWVTANNSDEVLVDNELDLLWNLYGNLENNLYYKLKTEILN
jgi:hypothetical protein